MGTKNDTVIAHLGERIGKLTRRCQALARMCNELVDKNSEALARVRDVEETHRVQVRLLESAGQQIEDEASARRALKEDNDRLRTAEADLRHALTIQNQEIDALRDQLAGERERPLARTRTGWPSITDVDWVVGQDYISPHLTGSWKLIEVRSDQLVRLTRQGAPEGRHSPDILADMDNNLCLSEGPF
jgi:hypothetical protein